MAYEIQRGITNYYEVLNITERATTSEIRAALAAYQETLEAQMNNPLSMAAARKAMNEYVPAILHYLLGDEHTRIEYDQQLAASRLKQTLGYEPEDEEGLDDQLRIPFLFNQLEDFDTEVPGYTLRLIADKLDMEWPKARTWLTDTADEVHNFVSYLMIVANRPRLAQRIENIIKEVSRPNEQRMDTNEGIERCIDILNPQVERPRVGIHNKMFDGVTLDAGSFISDLPAQANLIVGHEGVRGCAFGEVESRTNWVTFAGEQAKIRFALMPEGTPPETGKSTIVIPLVFQVNELSRNADHSAQLVLRMENQVETIEQSIQVVVHVQPLPPRISFEPEASQATPAYVGTARRGAPAHVLIIPRNAGDEHLIHLRARITPNEVATNARPEYFQTNEPITLSIDTSKHPHGKPYLASFTVDYLVQQAQGPATLYVQGETLPTVWQSMHRVKVTESRVGAGCGIGVLGLLSLGGLGAGLASHIDFTWLLFLAVPLLFILATTAILSTAVTHIQRAGNTRTYIEHVAPWVRWGIPAGIGVAVALVCMLIANAGTSFLLGGLIGGIAGFALGFSLDEAKPLRINAPSDENT